MSEGAGVFDAELNRKKTIVQAFLASLMTSAKTSQLYKPGHPMELQIGERMVALLQKTLGGEQNLTVEIKAKTVLVEESPLPETAEIGAFATAFHTLGVGGVLFTNRLMTDGMCELFRIIMAKPDEKNTLSVLQKALQEARIDGLQFSFIQSFVSTGETEQKEEAPGKLSADQIAAFLKSRTLPDFLTLILHQSERLRGKEAEGVTALVEKALYREVSLEKFESAMPWELYHPRIKARFEEFRDGIAFVPKSRGRRADPSRAGAWSREMLASWAGLCTSAELELLGDHRIHEHKESIVWALDVVHRILDNPAGQGQLKFALAAYVRVLRELGRDGRVDVLVPEFDRWQAMETAPSTKPFFEDFKKQVQEKVAGPVFVEQFVQGLGKLSLATSDAMARAADFCAFLGDHLTPMLLEELRRLSDKDLRQKLCTLLAVVGRRAGFEVILKALGDEDWFLVVNVIAILTEIARPGTSKHVAPCLKHSHAKTREAAMRFLAKFGGVEAADAIAEFIVSTPHREETAKAVITLSLMREPGVDKRLLEAAQKTQDYATRVSLVTALGRFPGPETIRFLKEAARRTWYEVFTGLNKELRQAARQALEQIKKESS